MKNPKNQNTAQIFLDDLDNLLDGANLKSYSEELIDNNDDFNLLSVNPAENIAASDGPPHNEIDKLSKVTDMERPGPKLVKIDGKIDKKRDIDALLDSFSDDDSDAFIDLLNDKDNFSKSDIRSIISNKGTGKLKQDPFDSSDDFEAFDEFGELDSLDTMPKPSKFTTAKIHNFNGPESLVDLEESLAVKFKPTPDKMEVDFDSLDNDPIFSDTFTQKSTLPEAKSEQIVEDRPPVNAPPKIVQDVSMNAIKEKPAIKIVDKPKAAVDYELLDDDFTDMLAGEAAFETAPVKQSAEDDFEAFKETDEVDGFEAMHFDDAYEDLFAQQTPVVEKNKAVENTSGFNEIEDIGSDAEMPVAAPIMPVMSEPKPSHAKNDPLETQLIALKDAQQALQQRVEEIATQKEAIAQKDKLEQLDLLSKERRDRKQLQELVVKGHKKTTSLAYTAAGISVLSLLLGGGMLTYGLVSRSDVKELKAHAAVVDQDLAVLKARSASLLAGSGSPVANKDTEETKSIEASQASVNSLSAVESRIDQSIKVVGADKASGAANQKTPTKWVANLVSVRQDWYAKQKAAEFSNQGISTVVVPVDVKGQIIYILRSNSFQTQDQALAFAAKAKKALNLSSILVSPDK